MERVRQWHDLDRAATSSDAVRVVCGTSPDEAQQIVDGHVGAALEARRVARQPTGGCYHHHVGGGANLGGRGPAHDNGGMRAVGARLRADLRTRWVSWLAVALAIGLAGAVVLTAAAGARRTGTAFDRFREASHADDLYISAGSPRDPEVAALRRRARGAPHGRAGRPHRRHDGLRT